MKRALFVDAVGTLLHLAEPVGRTYARIAAAHGVIAAEATVEAGFRRALAAPWPGPRMADDGRRFWRFVVEQALGPVDDALFLALWSHYARPDAWTVTDGAARAFDALRGDGVRVALVSNNDGRLRSVLAGHGLGERLDAIVLSSEVGAEKPDPRVFLAACAAVSVRPDEALHVGDSEREDVAGARAAGIEALAWGRDVASVDAVVARMRAAG